MNEIIKDIIKSNKSSSEKEKALELLENDIEIAKGIISGKWRYCNDCDDYYLAKSFITDKETVEANICTYVDPINSGGNDYAPGYKDITYRICPKGHKHTINVNERLKK